MDTNKTDQVIKFIEAQRVRVEVFGDNKSGERAYKRAERIVAAVFLMTAHVPEVESLKTILRTSGLSLLTSVLSVRDEMRTGESSRTQELRVRLREMASFVRLLAVAGYISFPNAEVLSESIEDLHLFLVSAQKTPLSESVHLSKNMFSNVRDDMSYGHRDGTLSESSQATPYIGHAKRPVLDTGSARESAIIAILSSGVMLGIKDIVSQLPEYSEKMIQRELAQMTDKGTVRKEGLKRWSRYALMTPSSPAKE